MVSSTDGSPTRIGWNRRSSAGSFSTYLRYSSSVVAPIVCNSPRASDGLSMFAASTGAPSALPAPTTVCSSSMNTMMLPSLAITSLRNALNRSSNSPRYFAPANIEPMSMEISRLPLSPSGTSPLTIRRASPSAMAVLPTPGSPMRTGLFFVRRDSTWITRRISVSRPMTGSSLPRRASSVRSRPYFVNAWYLSSGFWSVTCALPRTSRNALRIAAGVTPCGLRRFVVSARPKSMCSVPTNWSFSLSACVNAASSAARSPLLMEIWLTSAPCTCDRRFRASSSERRMPSAFAPSLSSNGRTSPSGC